MSSSVKLPIDSDESVRDFVHFITFIGTILISYCSMVVQMLCLLFLGPTLIKYFYTLLSLGDT